MPLRGSKPEVTDSSRAREVTVLHQVYGTRTRFDVTHTERPDFTLTSRSDPALSFGVEVTELYHDETRARVARHPFYVRDLLEGSDHMHADDLAVLRVDEVSISDSDGNTKASGVPAIVVPVPSHADHAAALAERIQKKDELYDAYAGGLTHVNLIVADMFDRAFIPEGTYVVKDVITQPLRQAIRRTRFQEVHIASPPAEHGRFLPLKMLTLMESFYLFVGALVASEHHDELEPPAYTFARAQAAISSGLDIAVRADSDGTGRAWFGGSGIGIEGDRITVLDGGDFPLPERVDLPPNPYEPQQWATLLSSVADFADQHVFECGVSLTTPLP